MAKYQDWDDFYIDFDELDFEDECDVAECDSESKEQNADEPLFCSCKQPETGKMIKCEGNTCPGNNWYHFSCCGITESSVPEGKWFCMDCSKKPGGRFYFLFTSIRIFRVRCGCRILHHQHSYSLEDVTRLIFSAFIFISQNEV